MGLMGLLEVALGLVLVFFLTSTLASAVNELLAQRFARRGFFLRQGLRQLVPDRWVYLRFVQHPLIASLSRDQPGRPRLPSYIPNANFSIALLDTVWSRAQKLEASRTPAPHVDDATEATDAVDAADAAAAEPTPPEGMSFEQLRAAAVTCRRAGDAVGHALVPLLDAAGGDIERARANVEAWFQSSADRVSGWYKRRAQWLLFWVGLAIAVGLNVDSIEIGSTLARSANLRAAMASLSQEVVATKSLGSVPIVGEDGRAGVPAEKAGDLTREIASLATAGLPVGYACLASRDQQPPLADKVSVLGACWSEFLGTFMDTDHLPRKLIGWLITALAVSLGAPFWFDLLNRVVSVRSSGVKPAPSSAGGPSA